MQRNPIKEEIGRVREEEEEEEETLLPPPAKKKFVLARSYNHHNKQKDVSVDNPLDSDDDIRAQSPSHDEIRPIRVFKNKRNSASTVEHATPPKKA